MKIMKAALMLMTVYTPGLTAEAFTYSLSDIESIDISAGIEFRIRCGDIAILEITADSEEDFKHSINNKSLKVKRKSRHSGFLGFWNDNDVSVDITLNHSPEKVTISAGTEGEMDRCFRKKQDLVLSVVAGSKLRINNNNDEVNLLEVNLSSGSEISLRDSLNVARLIVDISSGASLNTNNNIIIETVEVSASSGASINICGAKEVSGSVSSGASVKVSKETRTDFETSSGASINKAC